MLDCAIELMGAVGEIVLLLALLRTRFWKVATTFTLIEMVEFLEYPFIRQVHNPALLWQLYHFIHKLNIVLDIFAIWSIAVVSDQFLLIAVMMAVYSAIKILGYADAEVDQMMVRDARYWIQFALNLAITYAISFEVLRFSRGERYAESEADTAEADSAP